MPIEIPIEIHRKDVRILCEAGAQLVEVLSSNDFEEEHLPGAVNIPLKKMNRQTTSGLMKDQPVIVYCYDYQ